MKIPTSVRGSTPLTLLAHFVPSREWGSASILNYLPPRPYLDGPVFVKRIALQWRLFAPVGSGTARRIRPIQATPMDPLIKALSTRDER